jgi:hypothetical protein
MKSIEISPRDFERLQAFATPLVDTTATAFGKVLDLAEGRAGTLTDRYAAEGDIPTFDPGKLPSLTHTKVLDGMFDGKVPDKFTWDAMLRLALAELHAKFQTADRVRAACGANVVAGAKSDEGYKFLSALGLSYQGVSAEDAVAIILRAAERLGVKTRIEFVWRNKEGAEMPGTHGRIEV